MSQRLRVRDIGESRKSEKWCFSVFFQVKQVSIPSILDIRFMIILCLPIWINGIISDRSIHQPMNPYCQ